MAYSHTTFAQLKSELFDRLGDKVFWTDNDTYLSEVGAAIVEAMRLWGALTWRWRETVQLNLEPNVHWYNLYDKIGRLSNQTTDQRLMLEIAYHLLEPVDAANAWSSSASEQFTQSDIVNAIQRRRDQFLADTGCVLSFDTVTTTGSPPIGVVDLSSQHSTIIDIRRAAWKDSGGVFHHLWRDSETAQHDFLTDQSPRTPYAYSIALRGSMAIKITPPSNIPGQLELLTVRSGAPLDVAVGVGLGIPDNLVWAVKYGAMADLLENSGQAADPRFTYCLNRYSQGVAMGRDLPQALFAELGGRAIPLEPVSQAEAFRPGWQDEAAATPDQVFSVGQGMIAVAPKPSAAIKMTLTVVPPAPVPSTDAEQIQLGPEEVGAILDYAHHVASFKMGGGEFARTQPEMDSMFELAETYNERLRAYSEDLFPEHGAANRDAETVPRLAGEA